MGWGSPPPTLVLIRGWGNDLILKVVYYIIHLCISPQLMEGGAESESKNKDVFPRLATFDLLVQEYFKGSEWGGVTPHQPHLATPLADNLNNVPLYFTAYRFANPRQNIRLSGI